MKEYFTPGELMRLTINSKSLLELTDISQALMELFAEGENINLAYFRICTHQRIKKILGHSNR